MEEEEQDGKKVSAHLFVVQVSCFTPLKIDLISNFFAKFGSPFPLWPMDDRGTEEGLAKSNLQRVEDGFENSARRDRAAVSG